LYFCGSIIILYTMESTICSSTLTSHIHVNIVRHCGYLGIFLQLQNSTLGTVLQTTVTLASLQLSPSDTLSTLDL
jgi:hypothetical protein